MDNWFQINPIPANQILGTYNYGLVLLSYVIAFLASYVALDLAARVRAEKNPSTQIFWLLGGSFAMGAGIWSMHFIGMLAFIMPMSMGYEFTWTIASLFAAIISSLLALYILKNKDRPILHMLMGGVLMGIGIATMHYMGMVGMTNHINIRYLPSLFFLSILIAILASEAALWLALESSSGSNKRQFNVKVISALVMGVAICGMHYTGMAAAIFTPLAEPALMAHSPIIDPVPLAFLIAGITTLIIGVALVASIYTRRMSTAVQNEKDFLDIMLNNLADGILACNAKGNITVCNETLKQICLVPTNIGLSDFKKYLKLKLPNTNQVLPFFESPLYEALHGKLIRNQEYKLILPNNDEKDVVIDGQPIINRNNDQLGAVIAIHDVTTLKQTEKLKKEFVSIVSHELRTPLTSISGSLSLLVSGATGEMSEKMSSLVQIAKNNTDRLIRLINDILDIEKIEAGKMDFNFKVIDISNVVKDAIENVTGMAEKSQVKIVFQKPDNIINVNADYDRLIQVIVNLLSNAIRISKPGQTITVHVIEFDASVRVSILDQGSGIPHEFQNKIFQKFSQADTSSASKKGGTGLGLSISKAIIEKHYGTINFESSPKGTSFYFDLPKQDMEIKKESIGENLSKNVLICDSNPTSATLLKNLLEKNGITSEIALTAIDAKRLLQQKNYNLIALDLILQDYDGIKFIKELRLDAKTALLPIIVTSTRVSEGKEVLNSNAFPIIDWIEKPIKSEEITKLIEYIRTNFAKKLPHILCVEDNPDINTILAELLRNEAYTTAVLSIAAAREKLIKEPFDLIILDLRLPDGMGTDLLPAINCKTKEVIPAIVFSAYEMDKKYAHLMEHALVKTHSSNKQLFEVITSVLRTQDNG